MKNSIKHWIELVKWSAQSNLTPAQYGKSFLALSLMKHEVPIYPSVVFIVLTQALFMNEYKGHEWNLNVIKQLLTKMKTRFFAAAMAAKFNTWD